MRKLAQGMEEYRVMPEYRIYQLDDKGQSSLRPSVGIWKDDATAQANALVLFNGHGIEIWCGERRVATIKANA